MSTWPKADLQGKPRWGSARAGLRPTPRKGDVERFAKYARTMTRARKVVLPAREGERLGLEFAGTGLPSSDEVRAAGYGVMRRPMSLEALNREWIAGGNPLCVYRATDAIRAQWAALADEAEGYAQGALLEEVAA